MTRSRETKEKRDFFIKYIKCREKKIAVYVVFVIIFVVSFFMFHLPVRAVVYPAFLCAIIGTVVAALGLKNAWDRHKELLRIAGLSADLINEFPEPRTAEEEDYIEIIGRICSEHRQLVSEADRRYGDMVDYYTMWAHQIKTPIASMRLKLQSEDSEFSSKLSSELFRIEQYVEMVMVFLRLDSDYTDYVIKEYDLDDIVRQAVRKFSGDFIRKKLYLEYEPLNTRIVTDEKWLSFVIEQVLSNALKYTAKGGITISLEEPGTLCIRDTGIGIVKEDLPRIFDRGYTGYNGRSHKKASGIGLYLCRRICGNLGHGITAESTVDEGTVVKINLSRKNMEFE